MKNPKINASFDNRILTVTYLDGAHIDVADLEEIYQHGKAKAGGKPYCILFEATDHYDVTEEAIYYISNNPYEKDILAKAYIVNSQESDIKTKLHLLFDHPHLKPFVFKTRNEAKFFLMEALAKGWFFVV